MTEDFRTFNKQMLDNNESINAVVGTGTDGDTPQFTGEDTPKDIFTGEEIPTDTDLSEECIGTIEPKPQEPKLTICRDNTHRKGFFAPIVFMPVDTKIAIEKHLRILASKDEEFRKCFNKESKSLDECVQYIEQRIFSEMIRQAGGMDKLREGSTEVNGAFTTSCQFSDEDTYRLAEYYFRDDFIEQEKKRKAEMAEKQRKREETRKLAEKQAQKGKKKTAKPTTPQPTQNAPTEPQNAPKETSKPNQELSLFDF